MKLLDYVELRRIVVDSGYAADIEWAENVGAPTDADAFALEHAFVVCNSGMKAQIATVIFHKVRGALLSDVHPRTVFGHQGKCDGIWTVWCGRDDWFRRFTEVTDPVEFLGSMPWIGKITKWHLAKNFGVDAVKPDRHLVRVADHYGLTPNTMCAQLAIESGDRIGTVDYVIWRACNMGVFQSMIGVN
jgi:hypothetical protein